MMNQLQNTHKNQFSHPGKMVCHAPKLEQFRPNLKLQQICQNWKTPAISTISAQFRSRFQFWSSSFVPNCPNWRESLLFQGLASLEVFRKKTPSPYGRECPLWGQLSPVEGFVGAHFIFPNNQTGGLHGKNQSTHFAQSRSGHSHRMGALKQTRTHHERHSAFSSSSL